MRVHRTYRYPDTSSRRCPGTHMLMGVTLPLALLVLGILLTDHHHDSLATDHLAVLAAWLDRCLHLHVTYLSLPRQRLLKRDVACDSIALLATQSSRSPEHLGLLAAILTCTCDGHRSPMTLCLPEDRAKTQQSLTSRRGAMTAPLIHLPSTTRTWRISRAHAR